MKILLLGYGKMGKTIEQIALARGHHIVGRIGSHNRQDMSILGREEVDVVMEFSSPEGTIENIRFSLQKEWPIVCGTTGWLSQWEEIKQVCHRTNGSFFYASNYSIGVNLFFRLNKVLAQFMQNYPSYQVSMTEIHHTEKKDAPSGTAITLAEGVLAHSLTKTRWADAAEASDDAVPIESLREGTVLGTHTVRYTSEVDAIQITHTAHSREGFALGAVIAAEWLAHTTRKGIFGMEDLLRETVDME